MLLQTRRGIRGDAHDLKRRAHYQEDTDSANTFMQNTIGWFIGGCVLVFCLGIVCLRLLDSMRYRAAMAARKEQEKKNAAIQEIYGKDIAALPLPPPYEPLRYQPKAKEGTLA